MTTLKDVIYDTVIENHQALTADDLVDEIMETIKLYFEKITQ